MKGNFCFRAVNVHPFSGMGPPAGLVMQDLLPLQSWLKTAQAGLKLRFLQTCIESSYLGRKGRGQPYTWSKDNF